VNRLGLNRDGYHGERIDSATVLRDTRALAARRGWREEILPVGDLELVALTRQGSAQGPRIYLSAGIHGDEPASQLAARQLIADDVWPTGASLWFCPCLNPTGCADTTRTNRDGIDLNRDYRHGRTAEIRAHLAWLERQPHFDLYLLLHEDWESNGFYLYETNPDGRPSLAEPVVEAIRPFCPIESAAMIDGRESAKPGIIRPHLDPASRPEWAEALWLLVNRARLGYTLEAPSDWPLALRVRALVTGIHIALAQFTGGQV
jgi:murein peptide amidase A